MRRTRQRFSLKFVQERWSSLSFALAFLNLAFLAWGAFFQIVSPYLGITDLSPTGNGLVQNVNPRGPAYGKLVEGDIVISLDSIPLSKAIPFYGSKHSGDPIKLEVKRDNQIISETVSIVNPPPSIVFIRLIPLIVALIFWGVGSSIQAFKPANRVAWLFFLFCQTSSGLLTAGAAVANGPPWTYGLFGFLLWFIGPLAVHLHLHFPQSINFRGQKLLLGLLYGLAIVGGLTRLFSRPKTLLASSWLPLLSRAGQLTLAFSLLFVAALLFFTYRHTEVAQVRGKIRLVVLGGFLSSMPLAFFFVLPGVLLHRPLLSDSLAFLLLSAVPLTYGYAIYRHHLIQIERRVNRGATYILVYSVIGGVYLLIFASGSLDWLRALGKPIVNMLLVLILASLFVPLQHRIQKIVDTAFYGSWYDYRSAVPRITQGLEKINDLSTLAETVSERLCKTLHLETALALLSDQDGYFSATAVACGNGSKPPPIPSLAKLSNDHAMPRYLQKMEKPVIGDSLRAALAGQPLIPEEQQLLEHPHDRLYVGIASHGKLNGILALGSKFGGDIFGYEDLDILRVVAGQVGPLIENIHLLNRLRQYAAELEQRVAERTAELHAEKDRAEAILSSVGEGVIVVDLNGNILTVNHEFEAQTGYLASEAIGQPLDKLTRENGQGMSEEIRHALSSAKVWRGERLHRRKDGNLYNVHLTIAPILDRNGQTVGYVGSQRDITEHKKLDRLKDQFILEISHQLRTPLTNMSLLMELLERGKPEKQGDYLATLKSEIAQLAEMIERILELARLEIGKYKKEDFGKLDLNMIVEQAASAYRPLTEAGGLDLILETDAILPLVWGEPGQINKMVEELLSNAINFTAAGAVRLRTFSVGDRVCLEVIDNGIGMDADDQPHLFEHFYRGRNASRSRQKGIGLGLSIVREIVHIHNGQVEFESEKDKGSCFRVWLPTRVGRDNISSYVGLRLGAAL